MGGGRESKFQGGAVLPAGIFRDARREGLLGAVVGDSAGHPAEQPRAALGKDAVSALVTPVDWSALQLLLQSELRHASARFLPCGVRAARGPSPESSTLPGAILFGIGALACHALALQFSVTLSRTIFRIPKKGALISRPARPALLAARREAILFQSACLLGHDCKAGSASEAVRTGRAAIIGHSYHCSSSAAAA